MRQRKYLLKTGENFVFLGLVVSHEGSAGICELFIAIKKK
jgi:hypothetical protein